MHGVDLTTINYVPTHQKINCVLLHTQGGSLLMPQNKVVKSINEMCERMNGIYGLS